MSPLPLPILTLRLSSPSFLETVLTDAGLPLYSTETYENTTSLSRCDPLHGLGLIANIRWPEHTFHRGKCKEAQGPHVFMDGSSKSEDDLLKRNVLNTSRKFHIPGHSSSLKWKRVQGIFQCTSSAGTPVAVFEPAIITARARLSIFEPTLSGLPEAAVHGVSSLLVDYLIVTSLLLTTHPEDWRGFAPSPSTTTSELPPFQIPQSRAPSYSTPVFPVTSAVSDAPCPLPPVHEQTCRPAPIHGGSGDFRDDDLAGIKEHIENYEPPPPYEEIQWTVRVRQPRRHHA